MLFVPCAATIAVMRQETGQWRWVLASVGLMLFVALSASALIYRIGRGFDLSIANV
jgi:ferrous iron transport protein B